MKITPELAVELADIMEKQGLSEDRLRGLREDYPDLHFTYCMDDDIGVIEPVLEREGFNLYLVSSGDHCLNLTRNFDNATGLVFAEVCAEEE